MLSSPFRVIFDQVQRGLPIGPFRLAPRADIPRFMSTRPDSKREVRRPCTLASARAPERRSLQPVVAYRPALPQIFFGLHGGPLGFFILTQSCDKRA
jgi:hypothetical protein